MAAQIHPVILCGGSGTRLWPLSRQSRPKQFLPLTGELSLLQETAERVRGLPDCAAPILLSNEEHRFMIAEQLQEIGVRPAAQILEPVGRNTAPAVAAAALFLAQHDADGIMLVLPSDHAIADVAAFREAVLLAARNAAAGHLVTFGIKPTAPATGYGYIERAVSLNRQAGVYGIKQFIEKPTA